MCSRFPSRLYGIRVPIEHKRCQDKRRKGTDRSPPSPPTLFLSRSRTLRNKLSPSPLVSNIYRVNNKNSGALSPNMPFAPMLFNYFNIFKSFKCFKGAINPRHTYVCGFKGIGLWYERYRFMV